MQDLCELNVHLLHFVMSVKELDHQALAPHAKLLLMKSLSANREQQFFQIQIVAELVVSDASEGVRVRSAEPE